LLALAAMDASFSFAIDRPLGLIRIVMTGLFTVEDVAGFVAARREAHAALGCAPNQHLTLTDVREMNIQPQETVAAFHRLLADRQYRSRRLAFLVSPTLARSQLMRALAGRYSRCFDDPRAAEAWLLEDRAEEKADPVPDAGTGTDTGIVLPFRRVA
jgi:hypothetical protein